MSTRVSAPSVVEVANDYTNDENERLSVIAAAVDELCAKLENRGKNTLSVADTLVVQKFRLPSALFIRVTNVLINLIRKRVYGKPAIVFLRSCNDHIPHIIDQAFRTKDKELLLNLIRITGYKHPKADLCLGERGHILNFLLLPQNMSFIISDAEIKGHIANMMTWMAMDVAKFSPEQDVKFNLVKRYTDFVLTNGIYSVENLLRYFNGASTTVPTNEVISDTLVACARSGQHRKENK